MCVGLWSSKEQLSPAFDDVIRLAAAQFSESIAIIYEFVLTARIIGSEGNTIRFVYNGSCNCARKK